MAEAQPPAAAAADIGEETQCTDHPYCNNPGGICAFCLQEKLGKLVSSSPPFPSLPPRPPSPPFPSSSIAPVRPKADRNTGGGGGNAPPSSNVSVLSRSKSVAPAAADSPRKKSFWSFLHLSSPSSTSKRRSAPSAAGESAGDRDPKQNEEKSIAKTLGPEAESHASSSSSSSSMGRKVARSRSVGCGSRSFSGDFLERISTGFADCALRRVESHRESNGKTAARRRRQLDRGSEKRIEERVKCRGVFGGFGTISSPSPSSSAYWLSAASAAGDRGDDFDTRRSNAARASAVRDSRSRSWAWAFASPMRAFKPAPASKPYYGPRNSAVSGVNGARNGSGKVGGGNPPLLAVGGG